jgi:hypothetical protein
LGCGRALLLLRLAFNPVIEFNSSQPFDVEVAMCGLCFGFTRSLFVLAFVSLFLGCATKVKTLEGAHLSQADSRTTGFLFIYKFEAEDQVVGQDGCTVVFKNVETGTKLQLDVKYGKEFLLAEAPPGVYVAHDFECGRYNWDVADKSWAQFSVLPGKISALAAMEIRVSDNRRITVRIPHRNGTYKQMTAVWGLLNEDTKKSLISGYTRKPIREEMLENKDGWGRREISRDGKTFEKVPKSKFASFKTCYAGENQTNGLWLGQLKVDIDYKTNDAPVVAVEDDKHTFSDHFIECVKSEIIGFKNFDGSVKKARIIL